MRLFAAPITSGGQEGDHGEFDKNRLPKWGEGKRAVSTLTTSCEAVRWIQFRSVF